MMASQPVKKTIISSDLENLGQGHNLQTFPYLSHYITDFHQTFIKNDGNVIIKKNVISAELENVGQDHHLQ